MSGSIQGVQALPPSLNPNVFMGAPTNQIQPPNPANTFNPLAAQSQALGNQGQALQNQAAQLQVQKAVAQRAIGQHIQQTLNPDGTPNWGAALTAAAGDSHSAYGMGDLVNEAIQNGNVQASTARTILTNATQKYDNMLNITTPLLNKGPNVNLGDAASAVARGAAAGLYDPATGIEHLNAIRQAAPDQNDANGNALPNPKLAQLFQGFANQASGAQNALQNVLGSPVLADNGPNLLVTRTPLEGSPSVNGTIQKGVGPGQAATPLNTVNPATGASQTTTLAGSGLLVKDPATGNLVPSPNAAVQTSLDPQSETVLKSYIPDLNDRAAKAAVTVQNIQNMQNLAKLGLNSGAGSGVFADAAKLMQAIGAPPQLVDAVSRGGQGGLDAYQEFQKTALLANVTALKDTVGGDRVAASQMEKFETQLVNPETSPGARDAMLSYLHGIAQQPLQEQSYLQKFSQLVGKPDPKTHQIITMGQWPSTWNSIKTKIGQAPIQGSDTAPASSNIDPGTNLPAGVTP